MFGAAAILALRLPLAGLVNNADLMQICRRR